jgi:diguanylate cyclase (GGDEF)-like protein
VWADAPVLNDRKRWLGTVLAAAAVYYGAARLGFAISFVNGTVSAVWPPTGFALALVLIGGPRMWPAVFLGEFSADLLNHSPLLVSAAFATGSTCEALSGYLLLRRARFRPQLDRVRDVFALLVLAALLSTIVSATIGTGTLLIAGTIPASGIWSTWHVWWLGDVTGDVVVAPLLLVFASTRLPRRISPLKLAELIAFLATLALLAGVAHQLTLGIAYLVLPVLIWAALRFRQQGAVLANAVLASVGIVAAAGASSELARVSVIERVLFTQNFVVVGAITTFVLAAIDTERSRAAAALRRSESDAAWNARERSALGEVATAIARETATSEVLSRIAARAGELLGAAQAEVLRREDNGDTRAAWWSAEARIGVHGEQCSAPIAAGRRAWGRLVVAARPDATLPASAAALLERLADLAGLAITGAEARAQLQTEASTDALTGLANLRAFSRRIEQETSRARRYARPLSLVMLDLDGFKSINDTAGHFAGDRVLAEVARRICAAVREESLVARIGGDELAMLLPESDGMGAYAAAERVRRAVSATPIEGYGTVTLSAGIADIVQCGESDDLLRLGDDALYAAKRLGGNTVMRYSERTDSTSGTAELA